MSENEKNHYDARQQRLVDRYGDEQSVDPEFAGMYGRFENLQSRYGSNSETEPGFAPLDTSASRARAEAQKIKDHLAAAGADADRPMAFSVKIAGRTIPIQIREENGEFSCHMPVEIAPGHWEWRTLISNSGYDGLIVSINRILSAGPMIRDLSEQEHLDLSLLAGQNKEEAFWRYIELRTGRARDESLLRDPRYVGVRNDSVLFVFAHTTPSFPNTPQMIAHIRNYANGRPLSIPLCKAAMKAYEPQEPQPAQISETDIAAASDKELKESLRGLARARAEQDRKKRELVYGK